MEVFKKFLTQKLTGESSGHWGSMRVKQFSQKDNYPTTSAAHSSSRFGINCKLRKVLAVWWLLDTAHFSCESDQFQQLTSISNIVNLTGWWKSIALDFVLLQRMIHFCEWLCASSLACRARFCFGQVERVTVLLSFSSLVRIVDGSKWTVWIFDISLVKSLKHIRLAGSRTFSQRIRPCAQWSVRLIHSWFRQRTCSLAPREVIN